MICGWVAIRISNVGSPANSAANPTQSPMFRPITPKVLLNTLPISNLPGRPNVAVVMIISPESPPASNR
ncbi:hypothetical protein MPL3365_520009 [Mesorhizobium plurifarium]|uniref:Uncharacterized protein n=1 Tax=Mesorhizobium plurifarium TaxID=69974 RepID=A0A090GAQ6_MESPL|nr:hypothetical protein MPL3365_520009 [Mesorhizobium plurifarium]